MNLTEQLDERTPLEVAKRIITEYAATEAEVGENPCESDEQQFLSDVHRLAHAYMAAVFSLEAAHAERDKLRAELEAARMELVNLRKFAEDFRNNAANAWMFEDDGLAKREENRDG